MGAGLSLSGPETERTCASVNLPNRPAGLGDLPENCIASILSCLEASEICKFSCLNKAFLQASLSDTVWEPKLPENHRILAKKLIGEYLENLSSKKEIYTSLSNPSRFDGDTKVPYNSLSSTNMVARSRRQLGLRIPCRHLHLVFPITTRSTVKSTRWQPKINILQQSRKDSWLEYKTGPIPSSIIKRASCKIAVFLGRRRKMDVPSCWRFCG